MLLQVGGGDTIVALAHSLSRGGSRSRLAVALAAALSARGEAESTICPFHFPPRFSLRAPVVLVDRGAGGGRKAASVKPSPDSSSSGATVAAAAAATSGPRGPDHTAFSPALPSATPKPSHSQLGEVGTSSSLDDQDGDEDEDDTGEHIGRAPTATEEDAGEEVEMDKAVAHAAEKNAPQGTATLGRAPAESPGDGRARGRAAAGVGASADGRGSGPSRRAIGGSGSGDSISGGAGKKRVGSAHKKVRLLQFYRVRFCFPPFVFVDHLAVIPPQKLLCVHISCTRRRA